MRVVSLLPSATEILCQIGGLPLLVARSHECDVPPAVRDRPVLTGQAIPHEAPPAEIDRAVRDQLASGRSLYHLDEGRLRALAPDVILTQDLCAVCSIDVATVRRIAADLPKPPAIVSLNPHTIEDVFEDHLTVGRAVGLEREASAAVSALRERMYQAIEHVNAFVDGPNVAFLEWTDPLFIGGHWTPQLIERAGGRHPLNPTVPIDGTGAAVGMQSAFRRAGKSVRIPDEVFVASRPEAIVIAPCGVGLAGVRQMARDLAQRPWWHDLPAVRAGRVALVDGNLHFNRPGPRLAEALEFLVGWLNGIPGLIPPGFEWEPFDAKA